MVNGSNPAQTWLGKLSLFRTEQILFAVAASTPNLHLLATSRRPTTCLPPFPRSCSYLNRFEDALFGQDFRDPNAGYPAHINTTTFVDYMLLTELTKNPDGYRGSTFMHKVHSMRKRVS